MDGFLDGFLDGLYSSCCGGLGEEIPGESELDTLKHMLQWVNMVGGPTKVSFGCAKSEMRGLCISAPLGVACNTGRSCAKSQAWCIKNKVETDPWLPPTMFSTSCLPGSPLGGIRADRS